MKKQKPRFCECWNGADSSGNPYELITPEAKRKGNLTYILDLSRAPFAGVLESGMHALVLLIAIRVFDPEPFFKAMIPASVSIGLLLSPFVLSGASMFRIRATRVAALFWVLSGTMMVVTTFAGSFSWFLVSLTPSMFSYACVPTFMIFAYANNYSSRQRGQRIGVFFMISSTAAVIFSYFSGGWLDANISSYRWILLMIAAAAFSSALCAFFIPSPAVESKYNAAPLQNLSLVWKDRLFGGMLASWMFIGFANLMTIPLRVEYLATSEYGLNASNAEITILVVVIPSICRIISTRLWGYLFDRVNLLILRSVLNGMFMVSILMFFCTKDFTIMAIAMAITGLAHGGGNIAWNLWVTKIAKPEKTAAYMSVHTAGTGFRGLLSPFLGFAAISILGPTSTAFIASGLAAISILINLPLTRHPRLKESF